jgi:hypothetical protein
MEITKEMLFEEHAVVYEHAMHEIASELNISLDNVELVHRSRIESAQFHMLRFISTNGLFGGVVIKENDVNDIPQWPLSIRIIDDIKAMLVLRLTARA